MAGIIYSNHLREEDEKSRQQWIISVVNECWDLLVSWQLKYIANDLSFVRKPNAMESNYKSI